MSEKHGFSLLAHLDGATFKLFWWCLIGKWQRECVHLEELWSPVTNHQTVMDSESVELLPFLSLCTWECESHGWSTLIWTRLKVFLKCFILLVRFSFGMQSVEVWTPQGMFCRSWTTNVRVPALGIILIQKQNFEFPIPVFRQPKAKLLFSHLGGVLSRSQTAFFGQQFQDICIAVSCSTEEKRMHVLF